MSEIPSIETPAKRKRLLFIDMARSIAILLMLEGHFVDLTLGSEYRISQHFTDPDFLAYDIWHSIRGYTSPMFLTMTGLIFVYLLTMTKSEGFINNKRIKKGFKRVIELLFWGYFLNPNGFHILQCIGIGILGLLIVYGLFLLVKFIPLWVWYFGVSLLIFSCYAPLSKLVVDGVKTPWPENFPGFIQNMFNAPGNRSLFPLAPHLGYTFFGAGIGVLLHSNWLKIKKWNIPLFLFGLGSILAFFSTDILYFIHYKSIYFFGGGIHNLVKANWLFEIQGWVIIVLGVLSTIEQLFTIKESLFLRIGQNTLAIFIVHIMLLYGAVIRIGVSSFFNRTTNPLNPYEAAIGAAIFIAFFVLMIHYLEPLKKMLNYLINIVFPFRKSKK